MSSSSSLTGKLEAEVQIKASAKMFHDMLLNRPHHVSNAAPDHIHACDLHEGEWGDEGSIIFWTYYIEGKRMTARDLIEAVDPKNNSITFRILEGDLMEEYKSFVAKVQATPSPTGEGSVVHWVLEYEKLHEGIGHPETTLEMLLGLTKDMGNHLAQA